MRLVRVIVTLWFVLLGFAKNGNGGITSSFIRSAFPSTDIPLDDPVFASPAGYNAPHQVHITQGDYNGTAVIISWVTPDEPGSNQVKYGKSEKHYDSVAEGTYDTKYYYKLGEGNSSREFWFQTPPMVNPDVPYTFGIIGDLGQTYNSLSTLRHFMQSRGQAVIFLGDLSYADKHSFNDVGIRWDSWGRLVENSTAYLPWFWSVGNHEIEYLAYMGEIIPFKNYVYRYPTPYMASNSSSPLWYAIRRASAHIIVLNSYSPFVRYTPQWLWLQQELKHVNREETPWLIVVTHVPLYNSNEAHYMEGESMRAAFEEWFIEYKVDVIFSGHVHAYERSYRFSNVRSSVSSPNCYPVANESAPMYITVGDGGNQEGIAANFTDPQPDHSAFREASYGHSTLEIMNKTHAFYYWHRNDDGKKVVADKLVLHNQYWASNLRQQNLQKHHRRSLGDETASNSENDLPHHTK
ncbi:Purple acid phosphatase precursor, putative [Ricinus communis]|uniref:Purple acid phosphatase n=1 Tax=Ricinus communis TaxID=3988 RepID=B9SXP8_RICCO|nr:Purple acid phosphatase precursor, putative [Ricinus communis]